MMRRPPGETVANKLVFALVVLLVQWLVDAQQQQNQAQSLRRGFEARDGVIPDALHTLEATRLAHQLRHVETPLSSERRKNTLSANNELHNKNNYDASAIATLAPANPAVRAPPARRSTAESGGLASPQIARNLEDWEVEDFVLLATVDGKLYAGDRKTGKERWTVEVENPMIEIVHHRRNRSILEDSYRPIDDYLWVVEPSSDGRLFVYFGGGSNPGLVNTGLTMKKLVEEMSPYADDDPAVVYTGQKTTTMVTLDARDGRVIKWFGPGGAGVADERSCLRPSGLGDAENDECSTRGTVTLGRTEFSVSIHDKDGYPIATLKYSEWGPNNYDQDLYRQYRKTLDSKYVLSNHDGGIFAYDRSDPKETSPIFKQKFPYPVARVFDVARPWSTESKDPELVVLPQPVPPLDDENLDNMRNNRIFLNHTKDGSWYAMSGTSYPLVTDGPEPARCENVDFWRQVPLWEDMNDAQLSSALVGLHSIESIRQERLLTISPPHLDEHENKTIVSDILPIEPESFAITQRLRRLPSTASSSMLDFVKNPIVTIVVVFLLLLYNKELVKWLRLRYSTKLQPFLESGSIAEEATDVAETETEPHVTSSPQEVIVEAIMPQIDTVVAESEEGTVLSKAISSGDEDVSQGAETTVDTAQPTPKKRKAHRGTRGGVKHNKNRRNNFEDPGIVKGPATVEDAVRDAQKLGEQSRIEPDVQTLPNGVTEVSGPILRLSNSLEVNTEKLIGTGSNGTMVFEGKFDHRPVAVKRMLIQFFDIASQETKLLRESDNHPNVIRYYAQQQSAGFLYIALELCPASLSDVIMHSEVHSEIAKNGQKDLPNVLSQITNGLQHLHNLRIVHRDLKPQNILVTMGPDGKPRLLVSDFGLCKKLEGEQSSFRATTAHAAGTSGWRAPELLREDDAREGTSMIDASTHSGSGSILVSSDVMPNRRATRAIDIFSLGLVFFYVLTKGLHPFDCGETYMREVNIRNGIYNLSKLDNLRKAEDSLKIDYKENPDYFRDIFFEAKDLITSMLSKEPKDRPLARGVLAHPFFWSAKKRLAFLCDVSDHFEKERREPPSQALVDLEARAPEVTYGDFLKALGPEFVESLGKQRKYTGSRLLDLLRALRNKRNHYEDMSEKLQNDVGPLPNGYLRFWTRRFPNLLITCCNVVIKGGWKDSDRFREYFEPADL